MHRANTESKTSLEDSLNHFSLRKWSFISSLLMHWIPNVVNCLLLFHLLFFRHDLLLFQLGQISLSFHFTYLCLSIWNCVPQLTLAVLKWCLSVGTVIYHWCVPIGFVGRAGSDVITIHDFLQGVLVAIIWMWSMEGLGLKPGMRYGFL